MKRLLQLAVVAVLVKVAYDLVRKRAGAPLPEGAPYEPAPVPLRAGPTRVPRPPQPSPTPSEPSPADDLTDIVGIGPVYAARLGEHGIASFAALADADADAVAARLDVSASMVAGWKAQAQELRH